jgi:uncharacterized Zn finger protein
VEARSSQFFNKGEDMSWYGGFPRYVPVAERRRKAALQAEKLKKKGHTMQPVNIISRTIANTFWGKAWCNHLESYSDYDNRLPRGRTYVRNGSVIDLQVDAGVIKAMVSGSSIYKVKIVISSIISDKCNKLVKDCSGKIASLIELLQGKLSKGIMEMMTHPEKGLFPNPKEIKLSCSCPDYADMCKHVAAVLYGVGARLDEKPEELFLLRKADHAELIAAASKTKLTQKRVITGSQTLENNDLSALFGIDLDGVEQIHAKQNDLQNKKIFLKKDERKVPKKRSIKKAAIVKAMAEKIQTQKNINKAKKIIAFKEAKKFRQKIEEDIFASASRHCQASDCY